MMQDWTGLKAFANPLWGWIGRVFANSEGACPEDSSGGSSLSHSSVVSHSAGPVDRLSTVDITAGEPNAGNSGRISPGHSAPPSRVAYLKQKYCSANLSAGASSLLLASWRTKSSKSYDSMFQNWICWCAERNTDPISGHVSEVANFLADLYDQGYQYRSINSYRLAIASAHDRVEGVSIGQDTVITRLMAGIANSRPPQPTQPLGTSALSSNIWKS